VSDCWCGRPTHADLLDGCVGEPFLRSLFGPPTVESLILSAVTMCGDLVALAVEGDEQAAAIVQQYMSEIPKPAIEDDRHFLRLAGMDVTAEDMQSIRDWCWPNREEWPL
jgi:hypothetical protein